MKKIFVVFLSVVLCISAFCVVSFADSASGEYMEVICDSFTDMDVTSISCPLDIRSVEFSSDNISYLNGIAEGTKTEIGATSASDGYNAEGSVDYYYYYDSISVVFHVKEDYPIPSDYPSFVSFVYLPVNGGFGDLVGAMFENLLTVVKNSATALKNAFSSLVYVDPLAESPVLSPVIVFVFVMFGIGIGIALIRKIFALCRIGRR